MTEYVLGLLFSDDGVVLIRKDHPPRQRGRLNGIGGRVRDDESPDAAMTREFEEEAGLTVPRWLRFCVLDLPHVRVYCYRAVYATQANLRGRPEETELASWYSLRALENSTLIPDLRWLIPMAEARLHSDWPYWVRRE